jgi:hypothetical protein
MSHAPAPLSQYVTLTVCSSGPHAAWGTLVSFQCTFFCQTPDCLSRYSDGLWAGFPVRAGFFFLLHDIQTGPWATQPRIKCVPGPLCTGVEQQVCEVDHWPRSSAEIKNHRATLVTPHTSSWRCAWLIKHKDTLYPQKLALTSPAGCGRSVGIVHLRIKTTEFSFKDNFTFTFWPEFVSPVYNLSYILFYLILI